MCLDCDRDWQEQNKIIGKWLNYSNHVVNIYSPIHLCYLVFIVTTLIIIIIGIVIYLAVGCEVRTFPHASISIHKTMNCHIQVALL